MHKLFMSEIIYFWNNVWVETLHRWKNVKIIGIGKTLSSPERSCRKQAFWQTWHYSPIFGNNTSEQLPESTLNVPESNQVRNYKVIWIWVFILIVCTQTLIQKTCEPQKWLSKTWLFSLRCNQLWVELIYRRGALNWFRKQHNFLDPK